jgi:hypothetical protein
MAVTIEDNETAPTTVSANILSAKIFRIWIFSCALPAEVAADGGRFKAPRISNKVKPRLCTNTLN